MLQDITLGQFFPGNSILHRLDPRVKIILSFMLIILIFLVDEMISYSILTIIILSLITISKIPFAAVIKSLKPLIWIAIFTFLVHLVSHDGEVLYECFLFTITNEGIYKGITITLRLILLIVLSSLLMFTTSPLKLTDATEKLLSPLSRFGVPAHELAMMMTIALRFIPTLLEETDKIIKAQSARGVDFESGNIIKRAKSMVPILVPLFLSAFRRADELAMAMEARCYRGGEGRTHMKKLQITSLDYTAITIIFIISVFTLTLEHLY